MATGHECDQRAEGRGCPHRMQSLMFAEREHPDNSPSIELGVSSGTAEDHSCCTRGFDDA